MPEMGETPKLSQMPIEVNSEEAHEGMVALQPKREEEEENEKEDHVENEAEQSLPDERESTPTQETVIREKN